MALPARLLLADDDDANRDVLRRRLIRSGYQVNEAQDGAQALEMVKSGSYDLVLLDNMMPGMSGPQVLQRIREQWTAAELPVVMVTALDDSEHIVNALRQGANDYVVKPLDMPVVMARIETQLRTAAAAREARHVKELYQLAARASEEGLWDWDLPHGQIDYSPDWQAMLGYTGGEISSAPGEWFDRIHPGDLARFRERLAAHLEGGAGNFECEYRLRHKDGRYRWMEVRGVVSRDASGRAVRMAGYQSDVTARKTVDRLTSLPNRVWLSETLRSAEAEALPAALVLLEMDQFDRIEQTLPEGGAERLLQEAALRLGDIVSGMAESGGAAAVRSGDHQFGVLLRNVSQMASAGQIANRLQAAFSSPFSVDGQGIFATASAGIAMLSPDAPGDDTLRNATAALRRARELGAGRTEVFQSDMRRQDLEEIHLENDLRLSLERSEFEVYYQPKVDLQTETVQGMEALARWNRPGHGVVQPADFIPVAERTGLIVPLGLYILERACRDTAELRRTFPGLGVSVNVSGRQLAEPDLAEQVRGCLDRSGLEPAALRLEITETFLVEDPDRALDTLGRLRSMGVGLKLDDLGTGYSSLDYLQRFPFDSIKIDRGFVARLASSHESAEIIRAIAGLSRSLNMSVVAEGIETPEQLERLRELGCRHGQGFWFSPPVDLPHLRRLLEEWPNRRNACVTELQPSGPRWGGE